MPDRADEIAREIVSSATRKATVDGAICIIGHDASALINAIAAALRYYGDERLEEAAKTLRQSAKRSGNKIEVQTLLEDARYLEALKSQPIQDKP